VKFPGEVLAFGQRVRQLREAARLSQQELAYEADIAKRTVQRIEKGQYSATLDVVFALAQALNVPTEKLFVKE
jgi:DNA-binding XRE family transcriptional regulator